MKTEKEIQQLYDDLVKRTNILKKMALNCENRKDFDDFNLITTSSFSQCQILANVLDIDFDVNQFG